MLLSIREVICLFSQLDRGTECATKASRGADGIGIESNTLTNATDDLAAHTQWQHHGVICKSWNNVDRCFNRDAVNSQFDNNRFLLTAAEVRFVRLKCALCSLKELTVLIHGLLGREDLNALGTFEFPRKCWADLNRIIPSQLGDRIRTLHHPTIVGEATIVSV